MKALTLEKNGTRDLFLIILASSIMALSGQIAIPLWFTPVPLATQNSVVLLMAALLGARRGFLATLTFLIQGAIGLPVFSNGMSGMAWLAGPCGGYLIGYLIASFVVGYMIDKQKGLGKALFTGHALILAFGAFYLSMFVGTSKAFALGIAPFMMGDLVKIFALTKLINWTGSKTSN